MENVFTLIQCSLRNLKTLFICVTAYDVISNTFNITDALVDFSEYVEDEYERQYPGDLPIPDDFRGPRRRKRI